MLSPSLANSLSFPSPVCMDQSVPSSQARGGEGSQHLVLLHRLLLQVCTVNKCARVCSPYFVCYACELCMGFVFILCIFEEGMLHYQLIRHAVISHFITVYSIILCNSPQEIVECVCRNSSTSLHWFSCWNVFNTRLLTKSNNKTITAMKRLVSAWMLSTETQQLSRKLKHNVPHICSLSLYMCGPMCLSLQYINVSCV